MRLAWLLLIPFLLGCGRGGNPFYEEGGEPIEIRYEAAESIDGFELAFLIEDHINTSRVLDLVVEDPPQGIIRLSVEENCQAVREELMELPSLMGCDASHSNCPIRKWDPVCK